MKLTILTMKCVLKLSKKNNKTHHKRNNFCVVTTNL